MSEEKVELVAELLAKIGGTWYPERTRPTPGAVGNRHREVARLILETVERSKAANQSVAGLSETNDSVEGTAAEDAEGNQLHIGATVVYRPPGEKRTFTCRVERMEQGRAYLVPEHREIGWVSTHTLLPLKPLRENAPKSRAAPSDPSKESMEIAPQAIAGEVIPLNLNPQLKIGEAPERVRHYFNSFGDWVAFRRHESDRYLFDKKGNWIGWFPWGDNDIVDLNGQYLGTVMDGNRIYRRTSPEPEKREAGFIVYPGRSGYAGYPGHAAHSLPPFGFKDIDWTRIPTGKRFWLRGNGQVETSLKPSLFYIWMSKIGLGRVASWIENMIQSGR